MPSPGLENLRAMFPVVEIWNAFEYKSLDKCITMNIRLFLGFKERKPAHISAWENEMDTW